ncbi:MAG: hypothetical protein QOE28_2279 [Solirubrobacteraceae bacterium]|nr:hypothetical protein [Solirubrobacteraceae bacterium]
MSRNALQVLRRTLVACCVLGGIAIAAPGAGAAPGAFTQANVDQAIENGVNWLSAQQHKTDPNDSFPEGSWDSDTGFPVAETGLALVSYGVLANGHLDFSDVPNASDADRARWRSDLESGVDYLLSQQTSNGSWGDENGFLATYSTGIALLALSYMADLQSNTRDIAGAIAKGRHYLIMTQSASPSVTGNNGQESGIPGPTVECSTDPADSTSQFCGGWDYSPGVANYRRSDESNTGFGLTGLAATGGVPAAAAQANVGWQRNIQMLATNPRTANTTRNDGKRPNDGGGSYSPFSTNGDFSSNANDTGSLIFGYAYDKVPATDPGAQAAITFGQDVLAEYEHQKDVPNAPRTMVYNGNGDRSAPCTIGDQGCGWQSGQGEGGYHYSMFALSKGLGQYLPSSLSDPSNFYAQVVDLLLTQQAPQGTADAGSWPSDPRDDGSQIGATGFSIMSLGRVGQPANVSGRVYEDANNNATRDSSENGLAGWTVYADLNGNNALDSGEPTATTASDGTYTLQNLPEQSGTVREVTQSGYVCTQPKDTCAYAEKFSLGANLNGRDFGNRKPPPPVATGGVLGQQVCGSARFFTIKIRIKQALRKQVKSVRVTVNGKKVTVRHRNGRWTARVNLRQLRKGRYAAKITVTLKNGRKLTGTRRYRTCVPARNHGVPKL